MNRLDLLVSAILNALAIIYIIACRNVLPKGFFFETPESAIPVGLALIMVCLSYIIGCISRK